GVPARLHAPTDGVRRFVPPDRSEALEEPLPDPHAEGVRLRTMLRTGQDSRNKTSRVTPRGRPVVRITQGSTRTRGDVAMKTWKGVLAVPVALALGASSGCVTKKVFRKTVAEQDQKIDTVQGGAEATTKRTKAGANKT